MQLSYVKCDLEEMDFIMSMRENNLTEQLLPSKHLFSFVSRGKKYVSPSASTSLVPLEKHFSCACDLLLVS